MQFKHKETGDIIQGILSPCGSVIHCDNNIQANANEYVLDENTGAGDDYPVIEKTPKKKGKNWLEKMIE